MEPNKPSCPLEVLKTLDRLEEKRDHQWKVFKDYLGRHKDFKPTLLGEIFGTNERAVNHMVSMVKQHDRAVQEIEKEIDEIARNDPREIVFWKVREIYAFDEEQKATCKKYIKDLLEENGTQQPFMPGRTKGISDEAY